MNKQHIFYKLLREITKPWYPVRRTEGVAIVWTRCSANSPRQEKTGHPTECRSTWAVQTSISFLASHWLIFLLSPPDAAAISQFGKFLLAWLIGKSYVSCVNVIARRNLAAYWRRHPETEQPPRAWSVSAKAQNWTSMNAVLGTISKASLINAERCVFEICGGNYRLIVAFRFSTRVAFIKFIGTHAEFDRVPAAMVSEF